MKKGAVIVDTRLTSFVDVVNKHLKYLSSEWTPMIFTDDLDKVDLKQPHKKAKIEKIQHLEDYNRILVSEAFWSSVPFDKILIFQHDSELLRHGIEDFLRFDYVGAAWKFQKHGGNGGLSLRSKEAMLRTIRTRGFMRKDENEDIFFSNHLSGDLASREDCKRFSVETVFGLGSLGCHAIDSHFSADECRQIRNFSNRNR